MTLESVIETVKEMTPYPVTAETDLKDLGFDSLEFLELMVKFNIPDEKVPYINKVQDLRDYVSG